MANEQQEKLKNALHQALDYMADGGKSTPPPTKTDGIAQMATLSELETHSTLDGLQPEWEVRRTPLGQFRHNVREVLQYMADGTKSTPPPTKTDGFAQMAALSEPEILATLNDLNKEWEIRRKPSQ